MIAIGETHEMILITEFQQYSIQLGLSFLYRMGNQRSVMRQHSASLHYLKLSHKYCMINSDIKLKINIQSPQKFSFKIYTLYLKVNKKHFQ